MSVEIKGPEDIATAIHALREQGKWATSDEDLTDVLFNTLAVVEETLEQWESTTNRSWLSDLVAAIGRAKIEALEMHHEFTE